MNSAEKRGSRMAQVLKKTDRVQVTALIAENYLGRWVASVRFASTKQFQREGPEEFGSRDRACGWILDHATLRGFTRDDVSIQIERYHA
jgi:hypothetical protein